MPFVPIHMLKQIFPRDCLGLVDTTGGGAPDALLIEGVNILMPISMPAKVNLGNYTVEDAEKYGSVTIDGIKMNLGSHTILADVYLAISGELFTLGEIMRGKAAGKQIAMGASIKLLVKLSAFGEINLQPGMHQIAIEFNSGQDNPMQVTLDRELKASKMNLVLT